MDAIKRAVQILDLVSENDGAMRFNELQQLMKLPSPSTLARLLKSLCAAGVLKKDDGGLYRLSAKAAVWGKAARPPRTLQQIVLPGMERVNREFAVSVIVFEYCNGRMRCVEKIADENSPALQSRGVVLPPRIGVMGSYFFYKENDIPEELFLNHCCEIPGGEDFISTLENDANEHGYVYDYGQLYANNHRLAVPVKYSSRTVAVIGAGFMPDRLTENNFIGRLFKALRQAAAEIAAAIETQQGEY